MALSRDSALVSRKHKTSQLDFIVNTAAEEKINSEISDLKDGENNSFFRDAPSPADRLAVLEARSKKLPLIPLLLQSSDKKHFRKKIQTRFDITLQESKIISDLSTS